MSEISIDGLGFSYAEIISRVICKCTAKKTCYSCKIIGDVIRELRDKGLIKENDVRIGVSDDGIPIAIRRELDPETGLVMDKIIRRGNS